MRGSETGLTQKLKQKFPGVLYTVPLTEKYYPLGPWPGCSNLGNDNARLM